MRLRLWRCVVPLATAVLCAAPLGAQQQQDAREEGELLVMRQEAAVGTRNEYAIARTRLAICGGAQRDTRREAFCADAQASVKACTDFVLWWNARKAFIIARRKVNKEDTSLLEPLEMPTCPRFVPQTNRTVEETLADWKADDEAELRMVACQNDLNRARGFINDATPALAAEPLDRVAAACANNQVIMRDERSLRALLPAPVPPRDTARAILDSAAQRARLNKLQQLGSSADDTPAATRPSPRGSTASKLQQLGLAADDTTAAPPSRPLGVDLPRRGATNGTQMAAAAVQANGSRTETPAERAAREAKPSRFGRLMGAALPVLQAAGEITGQMAADANRKAAEANSNAAAAVAALARTQAQQGGESSPYSGGAGSSASGSRRAPGRDMKGCVSATANARGEFTVQNNCGEVVEVAWCTADGSECARRGGGQWTLGPGAKWPTNTRGDFRWGACAGRNTIEQSRDGENTLNYNCRAP